MLENINPNKIFQDKDKQSNVEKFISVRDKNDPEICKGCGQKLSENKPCWSTACPQAIKITF